jgi:hypothetical protein
VFYGLTDSISLALSWPDFHHLHLPGWPGALPQCGAFTQQTACYTAAMRFCSRFLVHIGAAQCIHTGTCSLHQGLLH